MLVKLSGSESHHRLEMSLVSAVFCQGKPTRTMWLISANRPQCQIKTVSAVGAPGADSRSVPQCTQGHPLNISLSEPTKNAGREGYQFSVSWPNQAARSVENFSSANHVARGSVTLVGTKVDWLMGGRTTGDRDGNHGEARGAIGRSQPFRRKAPTARASVHCLMS